MPCVMKRLPIEIQREVMSYLRTCDICGKSASANVCNYCDINCYYKCKRKQLMYCLMSICFMLIIFKENTFCSLLLMIPTLALMEGLF